MSAPASKHAASRAPKLAGPDPQMVRFAILVLLAFHRPLFREVFAAAGSSLQPLVNDSGGRQWVSAADIAGPEMNTLLASKNTLLQLQDLWEAIQAPDDPYTDPPCPNNATFQQLVQYIKGL